VQFAEPLVDARHPDERLSVRTGHRVDPRGGACPPTGCPITKA
jgi:hypothetical protein